MCMCMHMYMCCVRCVRVCCVHMCFVRLCALFAKLPACRTSCGRSLEFAGISCSRCCSIAATGIRQPTSSPEAMRSRNARRVTNRLLSPCAGRVVSNARPCSGLQRPVVVGGLPRRPAAFFLPRASSGGRRARLVWRAVEAGATGVMSCGNGRGWCVRASAVLPPPLPRAVSRSPPPAHAAATARTRPRCGSAGVLPRARPDEK